MPAANRSDGRDVHIFDARKPTDVLGGLILTPGVTNKNFYAMINLFVLINGTYHLRHNSDTIVPKDDAPLLPGEYFIVSTAPIEIINEGPLLRTISSSTGTRNHAFRDAVRARDGECIVTGTRPVNPAGGFWQPVQAAHIFPLAYEHDWLQHGHERWITKPASKGGSINSVQNGILLRADLHQFFDTYLFSINPNDNYKIVFFIEDQYNIAGNSLRQEFINNPDRPVDELLLWHFRQAVLTNMKGAGEPYFEHDFPSGSDMVGDILSGPMAEKRMEFELFSRLAAYQNE
ncbi:hypothetical protein MMC16_002322 [Acarospora aff. strigata]|nr:hypothetical protein [Acarospora aff. strigata]